MDAIDASAAVMRLYQIERGPARRARARRASSSSRAEQVRMALKALEKRNGVAEPAVEINRLENEADRAHQAAVRRLFDEEQRPDRDHEVEGDPRLPRGGHRPLRRRRQRARRRRREARLSADGSNLLAVVALIVVALVFDFINGFHDAANSIATVVSTRVLSPGKAVIWAAFFNFVAAFTFGTAVAKTIGAGLVDIRIVTFAVIFAGLVGAIVWDLITWYYGLPTSSSHALIGGYAGAAVAKAGLAAIIPARLDQDADLHRAGAAHRHGRSGFADHGGGAVDLPPARRRRASISCSAGCSWCRRRPTAWATAATTRRRRWASSPACCSPAATSARSASTVWVILMAHAAIALGTLSGGWRIIHTMGSKITKLQPVGGFAAETAGAISLFTATHLGVPVSTTHTITGAIIGVGSIQRLSAVRWGVAGRIVWAWILTIPASA